MRSTDGPLESVKIRCPRGHFFNGPLESMLWEKSPQPAVSKAELRRAARQADSLSWPEMGRIWPELATIMIAARNVSM
jgi:hypothetical protein